MKLFSQSSYWWLDSFAQLMHYSNMIHHCCCFCCSLWPDAIPKTKFIYHVFEIKDSFVSFCLEKSINFPSWHLCHKCTDSFSIPVKCTNTAQLYSLFLKAKFLDGNSAYIIVNFSNQMSKQRWSYKNSFISENWYKYMGYYNATG